LRFGVRYRDLFHGSPIDPAFVDTDFPDVRHLCIPALTDEELAQVWTSAPALQDSYQVGTENLRHLLRSPFNLFLMANIFGDKKALKAVSSQVELLHLYWAHRVIGNDQRGLAREALLRLVLNQMLNEGTLQVSIDNDLALSAAEDLYRLNSDGVLIPTAKRRYSLNRVTFGHHVLFDYAVARLAFDEGNAANFLELLTASDDRALLIAPGAMMALQMLWEEDSTERPTFWTKALEIASSTDSGAFCRMLPARVAAGLTKDISDFRIPLNWLQTSKNGDRSGLLFLVRHCIGALGLQASPKYDKKRDIAPCPAIARGLVETAIQDVGWMVKPLVAQWIEAPAALTVDDAIDINVTSRALLSYGSRERYDHSLVIYGIQGVARTFAVAPQESDAALRKLLEPSHVETHGFEELFWLAGELKHLFIEVPQTSRTIQDIYRATYCTDLPSKDEKTNLGGSRILALTSNKRQDFESARHILHGSFAGIFEVDPIHATDTIIEIVSCSKREERYGSKETTEIRFGEKTVRYTPD
jgi:hypothetical protein